MDLWLAIVIGIQALGVVGKANSLVGVDASAGGGNLFGFFLEIELVVELVE